MPTFAAACREHPPNSPRMHRLFLFLWLLAGAPALFSQSAAFSLYDGINTLAFEPTAGSFRAVSMRYGDRTTPALVFPRIRYRYRTGAGNWHAWKRWHRDTHTAPEVGYLHTTLLLLPPGVVALEVYVAVLDHAPADAALLRVYTPRPNGSSPTTTRTGDCALPAFANRADWCPDGGCDEHPNPTPTDPTHLIVHHSATSNAVTDYDAVVRAIWDFHVNTNGWSDIGYNWLIAPDGTLYAGRGDEVIGAHFCGQNTATVGICLLGNYVATAPTPAALETLTRLAAWKLDALGLAASTVAPHVPSGLPLAHLTGHRDGCATTCPGDSIYVRLPALRTDVDARIEAGCAAALAAPGELVAVFDGAAGVQLTWTDNSSDETGFELERAPLVNGPFSPLQTLPADTTAYLDTAIESDRPYFYRVRAVSAADTSAYSNQVFVLTGTVGTATVGTVVFEWFPNPASDELHLRFETAGERRLRLYRADGRLVRQQQTLSAVARLDLSALTPGAYWLQVSESAGSRTQRILVQ